MIYNWNVNSNPTYILLRIFFFIYLSQVSMSIDVYYFHIIIAITKKKNRLSKYYNSKTPIPSLL